MRSLGGVAMVQAVMLDHVPYYPSAWVTGVIEGDDVQGRCWMTRDLSATVSPGRLVLAPLA